MGKIDPINRELACHGQHKIKIVDEVKLSVNMFYLTSRSVFYSITLKKRASKIYDSHQQHQTLV